MPDRSPSASVDSDFQLMVVRYLDNDLNENELFEFERQLLNDADKRRYFIDSCRIVGAIADSENTLVDCRPFEKIDLPADEDNEVEDGSGEKRNPILGFLADHGPPFGGGFYNNVPLFLVAIGLSAFLFGLGYLGHQKLGNGPAGPAVIAKHTQAGPRRAASENTGPAGPSFAEQAAESHARLVETVECSWREDGPQVGEAIPAGKRLLLESGCIKIAFGKRAELILEGPADFSVTSATGGELRYGQLSAEVFDAGKGFTIDAPGMRVLDLGTAFGFHVDPDGQGQVHVFKGEVEVALTNQGEKAGRRKLLTEHLAVELNSKEGFISDLKLDPARFIRTFDRSDLDITRQYVREVKNCGPVAYWRFEYLADGCVLNEMSDRYRGSSPMRLVLSKDIQNKTLAVDQRSMTKPYMAVNEPIDELAGTNYTIECWVKPDGYQWITPVMLYFPNASGKAPVADPRKRNPADSALVAALVELMPGIGNETEPRVKLVRALHRVPPSGIYHDGVDLFSENEYIPDQWHHLVLVNDTDEMRLYMDGELISKCAISGKITEAPLVSIGRFNEFIYPQRRASDKEMAGQIDEVALYNKCLDEKTILRHFRLGMRIDMPQD